MASYHNQGGAGDVDSDLHGGAEATVVQGEYDDTYDFGYYYPARIHGYGYADRDGTLMRDPGDPGTSNMLIKLYLDGVEVAVTNAAADGFYSFDNLKPGAYEIRFYGDNDYLTERPQEGTSEAENIERNRAEKSDKDYAVIYHTVYSGDYYREGSFNQPLNAGYRGTGPMSSGIDLRAYAAADGVYVEFIAYDVEADDWVSLYLVGSNGVVIWFDDVFIEAGEQQFARFKVPSLEAGQKYDFAVRDEVGKVWWVYDVKVGTLKTEMISMTNSGVVLSFTSLPERSYTVQWSARLGTFWQPVVTIKAIDTKTTVVVQPPDKSSPTGFFRVVLQE